MSKPTSKQQRQALNIAVIIALVFGAYFLRHFFSLIVFAAIMTYLFNPIFHWFIRKGRSPGGAASLTMLVSFLALIIPLIVIVIVTTLQVKNLLHHVPNLEPQDVGRLGQKTLDSINNVLTHIPGQHAISFSDIQKATHDAINALAKGFLNVLTSSASSVAAFFTGLIIYMYVFVNLLVNQDKIIQLVSRLNPLGTIKSQLYLAKMGAMTGAMVRGQFIIAVAQGLVEAIILYIAGLHDVFFFLFLVLSLLSIIPLGGGIIAIPIGIVMLLSGDIWQGALVLIGHFTIVVNIDNVLRPRLVPKTARLNSALTLLAVFAGIGMFGFLGIVIGPVIMILITTTIEMYLEANQSAS